MIAFGSPCRRHRAALVAFVDRREHGPTTPAALDHLARCRSCEREVAEMALTIVALRRAGRELVAAPVPAMPAVRIAARGRRSHDPWAWRLQLGALATSAAIVALVVTPQARLMPASDGVTSLTIQSAAAAWLAAESRLAATPDVAPQAALGTMPPRYPDGLTRPWKEVPSADATPREFEPR